MQKPKAKAVVLLSGGLDSATVLAQAISDGFEVYALSIRYGQRHSTELEYAKALALRYQIKEHKVIFIDLAAFGGSALTDMSISVPDYKGEQEGEIPITYVPARNTIFLSYALGWAEVLGAFDIFIGANAVDYSGYPDCRPAFIEAFERLANVATAASASGEGRFHIHAPLIALSKKEIIARGIALGVDYGMTRSCYSLSVEGVACGVCDSCKLRLQGFSALGVPDPAPYRDRF